jgi:hypothetical protein
VSEAMSALARSHVDREAMGSPRVGDAISRS